jgi:2-polyprenyl-3-methyl-5-hydroxy-6-metoxy-1,4-benzoquinol methylase
MPSFSQRSLQKELLDGEGIPFADIRRNMQELNFINTWLGGHDITLKGLKRLLPKERSEVHVVEIGCGGGDNLRVVKRWLQKAGYKFQLTGIDINRECIQFAQGQKNNAGISFVCSDYRLANLVAPPDIIFSSLFCHHFTDEELVEMLQWKKANSRIGFFINDLHRHALAYYSIKGLTAAFSKSYLVKNDAPLSVQRGFIREEWTRLFSKAGINKYTCSWQWAFRWLITYKHD